MTLKSQSDKAALLNGRSACARMDCVFLSAIPSMEAGVTGHIESVEEIVGLMGEWWTMHRGAVLWTEFLILGALLWLASVGVWNDPVYKLCLMVVAFWWFGHTVRAPK